MFGVSLAGKALTLLMLVIRLEMFKWKPARVAVEQESRPKRRHVLSPGHVKVGTTPLPCQYSDNYNETFQDSFRTFFKRRSDNKRFYILTYTAVYLTIFLPFFGEGAVSYNYVRTRFNWDMVDYSNYDSICSIIDLVGQAVFIPLLGYLQLPDANIIPFITFTIFLRHMIKGFAVESWMMYLGSSIDLMASYSFSAIRSLATKCVEGDEVGKMLALIYSVESIIPMFMTQVEKTHLK